MEFHIHHNDSRSSARTGEITTSHGKIKTPVFMPVGTLGSVKGVHFRELENDLNARIILGNAYHLYLRPGIDTLKNAGGLHKFTGWDRFILTDSGGYQVYSLAKARKIKEDGVHFQSHIDGSSHIISPEKAIDIQRAIGADIMMAFDECTPWPAEYDYAKKSMDLTHRWLQRCWKQFESTQPLYDHEQQLFPIVQGSTYEDLREKSAKTIAGYPASGYAIGGLSVGEPHEQMYNMTKLVCSILPKNKPRYLMGVGTPANILESVALGIDMFDCVMPTRNARHGILYTRNGIINIKNEKWKNDFSPIHDPSLSFTDQYYSKAYLRHLLANNELLAAQIASISNLAFYLWLMKEIQKQIEKGTFYDWKDTMVNKLSQRL